MILRYQLIKFSILQVLIPLSFTYANSSNVMDTCAVNDVCENATIIDFVYPGDPFTCLDGCNLNALPSVYGNDCQMHLYPTVWYKVPVYNGANVMNVNVHSDEFENPMLAMYYGYPNCSLLFPIHLTNNNNTCVVGSDGMAEAVGIKIEGSDNIYIAVSSLYSIGGTFSICINTIIQDSMCVLERHLEVIERSEGGPLEGPYSAGEKISMCFTVESYTAIGNACQWFQGLVPVFGNGWDPSSFDSNGQPYNSTINDYPIGQTGNGIYGAATWDWFNEVGYHHTSPWLEIGDHDGDGQIEMCNTNYEINCVNTGGIQGGCCGPCWDDQGVTLPPGWFAYGINGTCPTPGPPIAVDWGDGNTCGCCMGPWKFCFDLVVRSFPDCLDSSYSDLSVAFYTFADGEIGAWLGGASVCGLDHPLKMDFSLDCIKHMDLGTEYLRNRCSQDTFEYVISEPGIRNWIWSVSPAWPVEIPVQSGDNGFKIIAPLTNPFEKDQEVTYLFIGQEENSIHKVVKRVKFNLYPDMVSKVEDKLEVCEKSNKPILITPEYILGGNPPYFFSWNSSTDTTDVLMLNPPFENGTLDFSITDGAGCVNHQTIEIETIYCLPEISISTDQSNDKPTEADPLPFGSRLPLQNRQSNEDNLFKVYPIPSKDKVILEWPSEIHPACELNIYNVQGTLVETLKIDPGIENMKELDITPFSPGVYFINLISNNRIYTARLVKI